MEAKDVLALFFERSNAMQTYWNFYVTIVLALLAFFGAGSPRSRCTAWLMTIAFVGFAIVNGGALHEVTRQRVEVCEYLAGLGQCSWQPVRVTTPIPLTLHPPTLWGMWGLHILADTLTIAAIWFLTLRPDIQRPAANDSPKRS